MLPEKFTNRMKEMLGGEFDAFLASYGNEKYQALRLNPLKVEQTYFIEHAPFELTPVPWAEHGFYYGGEDRPGRHILHEAGAYYIQEPSAMAPAEYLDVQPGMRVLDLCAAPGGKSTQIALKMKGEGILISNEIHPARAKILSENMERMGVRNAIVTNETPAKLAANFVEYFDRIMVDAPCSGEGMFRKNEAACEEWSEENVQICAERQDEILDCAYSMLGKGGRLVYSTCTFAPAENEGSIGRFRMRHPDMEIVPVKKYEGMGDGVPQWSEEAGEEIKDTIRLWPHRIHGEGHYVAVLQKTGDRSAAYVKNGEEKGIAEKTIPEYMDFARDTLKTMPKGIYVSFGDQIYLLPEHAPALKGLKVLRPGLHLGTRKKNRFEPAHALALALGADEVFHSVNLSSEAAVSYQYLNGQTFSCVASPDWQEKQKQEAPQGEVYCSGEKGWYLVTVDGISLGWGKLAGSIMKNHYPKGLRKNWI